MAVMTVQIFKTKGGAGSGREEWRNVYHFETTDVLPWGGPLAIDSMPKQLLDFETSIHLDDTIFDRMVISTYAKEGRAGHPEAVQVVPLGLVGQFETGANHALPLVATLDIKMAAESGRAAPHRYRNCLLDNIARGGSDGQWQFVSGIPITFTDACSALVAATGASDARFLAIPQRTATDGEPSRRVIAINVQGVSNRQERQKRKHGIPRTPESLVRRAIEIIEEIGSLSAGVSFISATGEPILAGLAEAVGALAATGEAILPALLAAL